ncbi:hypothetical protein NDN08_001256 [Rhodosorus marinus]|uniref:Uncharacterized protein n=1 Tax=Rhodosorus marinus TaxID=101924 RepID=A0AAV8UQB8_9RHOD|nr:hypothetical protein NDN08_001256 [Rhodosorus marinus]
MLSGAGRRPLFVPVGGAALGKTGRSRAACYCSIGNHVKEAPLTLHTTDDTSIKILYPVEKGEELINAVNSLILTFNNIKNAAEDGKRFKGDNLEYFLEHENVRFELQCNPNLFPELVHAKVYVKADDGRLCVSSMALLPKLIESVKLFKAQQQL